MDWSDDRRYVAREKLIELLGEDAAARVVKVFGGRRIYVPAPTSTDSYGRFVARLGDLEIARKLCFEFGGTQIILPQKLAPLNEQIVKLKRESVPMDEIRRRLGCTESYIYYVLAKERRAK